MLHDLRHKWHSTFFELIVARLLQELGASLVSEGSNREGRRPDFTAQFSDGAIIVEAKAPVFNFATQSKAREAKFVARMHLCCWPYRLLALAVNLKTLIGLCLGMDMIASTSDAG
jgi:hypothetical protein